tara:strand:- start:243 stop:440 length:198 start_codon:yes stop_codon:yes gene_type:complete
MEVVAGKTVVVGKSDMVGVSVVLEATIVVGKSEVLAGVSVSEAPPQAEANRSKQKNIPSFFMLKV